MASITLRVNGTSHTVDVDPATPLLYVAPQRPRPCTRAGCGLGRVRGLHRDHQGRGRALVYPADLHGRRRRDHDARRSGQDGKLHPLQQAWIDEQVPACGYCQNGQIMTAKAMLDKTPSPTDAQIRQGMAGTLCRCMTYYRIQSAIKRASKTMASASASVETSGVIA